MRAAIHRHLVESRNRSIIGNPEYAILDKTLKACIAAQLREPRETRHLYDAIEPEDMEKLGSYFNRSSPARLLWEVFFLIVYHFGFRGREWLRNLSKESIVIKLCPVTKLKFVDLIKQAGEKNVHSEKPEHNKQIVMFEKPNSASCPVKAVELYLSKLPMDKNVLFPKPLKPKRDDDEWYSRTEVLGKHTLFDGMKIISDLANLSKKYTNHCIRASVVTTLSESGFSASEIQSVTGQKRAETVERYTKRVSTSKKMKLSHTLSDGLTASTSFSTTAETIENRENEESSEQRRPTIVIEKDGIKLSVYL